MADSSIGDSQELILCIDLLKHDLWGYINNLNHSSIFLILFVCFHFYLYIHWHVLFLCQHLLSGLQLIQRSNFSFECHVFYSHWVCSKDIENAKLWPVLARFFAFIGVNLTSTSTCMDRLWVFHFWVNLLISELVFLVFVHGLVSFENLLLNHLVLTV